MFEEVKAIIVDTLNCEEDKVTLEANIFDDLGADSLDVVDLISSVEDEFDVEIPDEEVPMAMVPKTGDASMSWFLAAIASALGLAGLTIADRKRKSEDAE